MTQKRKVFLCILSIPVQVWGFVGLGVLLEPYPWTMFPLIVTGLTGLTSAIVPAINYAIDKR